MLFTIIVSVLLAGSAHAGTCDSASLQAPRAPNFEQIAKDAAKSHIRQMAGLGRRFFPVMANVKSTTGWATDNVAFLIEVEYYSDGFSPVPIQTEVQVQVSADGTPTIQEMKTPFGLFLPQ